MKIGPPVNRTSGNRETPGDAPNEKGPTHLQRDSAGRGGEPSGPFEVRCGGPVQAMTARRRFESELPPSTSLRTDLLLISSFGRGCFSIWVMAAF